MRWILGALAALLVAAPAQAAQIPTADEGAALRGLVRDIAVQHCEKPEEDGVPLVSEDRTWGRATTICGDPSKGGAAYTRYGVWAHRSSATATDWAIVGDNVFATRVPPCTDLLNVVPEAIVLDLREQCYGEKEIPSPDLSLLYFEGEILMTAGESLSLSKDAPPLGSGSRPTLEELRHDLGAPQRTRCSATWKRLALKATVCASGKVTRFTLGTSWRVGRAQVGDPVELARYLERDFAKLKDSGRTRLAKLRLLTADATITAHTRGGRLRAITIDLRQRR